jgi:glycosyltransferase involved in cell wall biosynthesis
MKILHIIDSGGLYGAEVALLNLVAEQMKLGLSPTIASIGKKHIREKPLEKEAQSRGFRVMKFRMLPGPNPIGALRILRFAHEQAFDVIHSHGYKGNILFGLIPRRLRKIPLVCTVHGWTSTSRTFTKIALYEWLDSICLRFIDIVVLVSHGMRSHPRLEIYKGANIRVVPNGIPISSIQFPESTAQRYQKSHKELDETIISFCKGDYVIGSIGRLSVEKGYRYLVEAVGLLCDQGIVARLVIIGEGYDRDFLEMLVAQLGLSQKVLLPGYLPSARSYMPYFDAFVNPSLTEGLPMTLLEAMYAKVPIVATQVGGTPELLHNGRGGLLVEPCKPEAIAEALTHIYFDEKLVTALVDVSYQRVTTCYSSQAMASGYSHVYEETLSSRDNSTHKPCNEGNQGRARPRDSRPPTLPCVRVRKRRLI